MSLALYLNSKADQDPFNMRRLLFIIPLIFLVFSSVSKQRIVDEYMYDVVPDSLFGIITQEEYNMGWRPLFNGENLDGWKGFLMTDADRPPGWFVADSLLITRGDSIIHPVDLISKEQFEDFELSIEWAICWQGNSGIFYHSLENSWAAWAMGPEYAIVDQANLNLPDGIHSSGANYEMQAPIINAVKPQGQFNVSRIKVKDAHVEHWLNGEKVVEYELWSDEWYETMRRSKWKDYPQYGRPIKGSIGLQGHGFETKFRNIKIRDLTEVGDPLIKFIDGNSWDIIGESKWVTDEKKLVGNGNNTGIKGHFTNSILDSSFMLRFQFLPENSDSLLVYFSSETQSPFLLKNRYSDNSGILIEEDGFALLLSLLDKKPVKTGQWNEMVIRRKGNQVLMWINNVMVVEKIFKIFPTDLISFGIHLYGTENNIVTIQKMYFKKL